MKKNKKFLIIGDANLDVHLDFTDNDLRLGGVFHSARALAVLRQDYCLAIFCSKYQVHDVKKWAKNLKAIDVTILGIYTKQPNVMLINESTESGDQGYKRILYKEENIRENFDFLENVISEHGITDVLVYPSSYCLDNVLDVLRRNKIKIHFDSQYSKDYEIDHVETLILSTSPNTSIIGFSQIVEKYRNKSIAYLLLKENRGGSRMYSYERKEIISATAYKTETVHSVGVGDVFNAFIIANGFNKGSIELASKASAIYASTMDFNEFEKKYKHYTTNGIDLPIYPKLDWEERNKKKIYLASPDFPNTITREIAQVIEYKLKYHNFSLTRPIKANGLITDSTNEIEKKVIFYKDLNQIYKSDLCIAILNEDDAGTSAEIGMFYARGIPIIGYNSSGRKLNNFLEKTCTVIADNYKDLIEQVFIYGGNQS